MNVAKCKVLVYGGEDGIVCDLKIQGEQMEQVQDFIYLSNDT